MAVTNDPDLAATMARLRTHGITRESALMRGESHGPWYYQQIELGFNYRMTDIQAALGASQMTRLEGFVARRRELAARYDAALADVPVIRPWQHPDTLSAWHLYVIQVDPLRTSIARGTLFDRLRAADIGVNVHYIPVHTQPYYAQLGFAPGHCPAAERYYANAISLPLYSAMTEAQQSAVLDAVRGALT
jgi:dTDP-4-amino-4,6-dideoxygalactose transaminase